MALSRWCERSWPWDTEETFRQPCHHVTMLTAHWLGEEPKEERDLVGAPVSALQPWVEAVGAVCHSPHFSRTNLPAPVLLCPAGPSTQRQVQNGPSPDEMDIQRRYPPPSPTVGQTGGEFKVVLSPEAEVSSQEEASCVPSR